MTASRDSEAYLRTAFSPDAFPIVRVQYSIDPNVFPYGAAKQRRIAYMPRRNADHAQQILAMLSLRGKLGGWDIVGIDGASEDEAAGVLGSSAMFLSFGFPEGFGLPPAEAMSCGCVVVGYHGLGGREYFSSEFSYPIEFGDVRAYVEAVEHVTQLYDKEPDEFAARGRAASDFIQRTYSPSREAEDVVAAWTQFLERSTALERSRATEFSFRRS
jgi:glycosyltransferase involved in cell wall biosynthesis